MQKLTLPGYFPAGRSWVAHSMIAHSMIGRLLVGRSLIGRSLLGSLLLVCSLGMHSAQSLAQAGGASNELVLSLYNQLEALQSEVQNLRGMVEEQAYQIKQLESEARERYLDLDQRLVGLNNATSTSPGTPGVNNAPGVSQLPVSPGAAMPAPAQATLTTTDGEMLSEEELYRSALSLLLDQGDSQGASRLFQRYIDSYPAGRLLPNALYWQGEALILLAEYGRARDMFERVLRDFPQDLKAPGAMLKLGVVHNHMGDRARAEQLWQDLLQRYPESSQEIGLARDYLGQQR